VEVGKALTVAGQPAMRALALLHGFVGVLALVGVALARPRPRAAALILATAGLTAITVDGLGSPPPRVLPGAALLIAGTAALASMPVEPDTGPAASLWAGVSLWIGLGLHFVVGIPFVAAGLVAPGWAVTALWAAWGALLALILRFRRTRPWLALAFPPMTAALFVSALSLGERFLGWSP
jgi:hypothetical protein